MIYELIIGLVGMIIVLGVGLYVTHEVITNPVTYYDEEEYICQSPPIMAISLSFKQPTLTGGIDWFMDGEQYVTLKAKHGILFFYIIARWSPLFYYLEIIVILFSINIVYGYFPHFLISYSFSISIISFSIRYSIHGSILNGILSAIMWE